MWNTPCKQSQLATGPAEIKPDAWGGGLSQNKHLEIPGNQNNVPAFQDTLYQGVESSLIASINLLSFFLSFSF